MRNSLSPALNGRVQRVPPACFGAGTFAWVETANNVGLTPVRLQLAAKRPRRSRAHIVLHNPPTMTLDPATRTTASTGAAAVVLRLSGVARVALGDVQRILEPKDALLVAWLAIEGPTARARLGALLFPDSDEAGARNNLRQRLF